MADLTADFEAGSNGNAVTTAAGEASLTKFDVVTGTVTYDNAHAHAGTLAAKCASGGASYIAWNGVTGTEHYGRVYLWFTAFPNSTQSILVWGGVRVAQTANDGKLFITDNTVFASFTNAIATGQWIRLEWHVLHHASAGTMELKLFNDPESSTPTETQTRTGLNTGSYSLARSGPNGDIGTDVWMDDVIANASSYPGPTPTPAQTLLVVSDSVDGAWTDQAGGTSLAAAVDEATFDDADYIRSELNPSASGCRVKLASGGDPHVSTGHVIHWRTGKIGSATINMTVKLYQGGGNSQGGGTLIASFDRNNVGALTSYTETLSGGEADSITDYTDLYLEFFADTA